MYSRTYMLIVVVLAASATVFAQSDQWRDENIGMPSMTAVQESTDMQSFEKDGYAWLYDLQGRLVGIDLDLASLSFGEYILDENGKAKCVILGVQW